MVIRKRKEKFQFYSNQGRTNSPLNGKPLKLIDQFIYLGSNISSTESDINIHIGKINGLMTIRKSDLSDEIKQEFFHVVAMSILYCYNIK